MKSLDGAVGFLRQSLFNMMDETEKSAFAQWLDKGKTESIDQLARGAIKCCRNWDGFLEVSDMVHSDWGFEPARLDDDASKPMLVVGSEGDHLGGSTNGWLVANYKSAKLKVIPGGHISSLYYMDEIWRDNNR